MIYCSKIFQTQFFHSTIFLLSQITAFFLPVGFSHEIVEYFMKLNGKLFQRKAIFLHIREHNSIQKSKPGISKKILLNSSLFLNIQFPLECDTYFLFSKKQSLESGNQREKVLEPSPISKLKVIVI